MKCFLALLAAAVVCAVPGCDKPEDILNVLQKDVAAYAASPTDAAAAEIDAKFSRLDARIARLRSGGRIDEATSLANRRDALQAQYAAARMTASLLKAKEAAAGIGEAFRKVGEAFGQALKGAATNQE